MPPTDPEVSIIIPVHNGAGTIEASVMSALTQRGVDSVEVVVVDDGSTDGTSDLVGDMRGAVLLTQPNAGPSSARNAGVRASRAPVVAFLDADDTMLPYALRNRLDLLDGGTDLVMTVEKGGLPEPVPQRQLELLKVARTLSGTRGPSGWCLKRTTFDKVGGFDPSLRCLEDVQFSLRALSAGMTVAVHDVETFRYAGSGTGRSSLGVALVRLAGQAAVDPSSWAHRLPDPVRARLASQYLTHAANVFATRGDIDGLRSVRRQASHLGIERSVSVRAAAFPRTLVTGARWMRRLR